jgi:malonyl-CoA O-methyltransferase
MSESGTGANAGHVNWVDAAALRRTFDRAAAAGGASFIAREIERRMAERLDYIRHEPKRLLDAGCGSGESIALLRRRYPRAEIIAIDAAAGRVRRARGPRTLVSPLLSRFRALGGPSDVHWLCGDLDAAAIKPASGDMLWSNVSLAWSSDVPATIRGWGSALATGGLAMFSTFGPDTLRELAAAFAAVDAAPHVHPFTDMHDIGDMLVAAGFTEPVIDMERLTLTYASPEALIAELRGAGYANVRADRRRTLTGRTRWQRMLEAYAATARDGRVSASFEVVYGHAWKAAPRVAADGRAIVHFGQAPRGLRNR